MGSKRYDDDHGHHYKKWYKKYKVDANNDKLTTDEDAPLTITAATLLANDKGKGLEIKWVSQPKHGELTRNADGTYTYTPDKDFAGTDYFKYKVVDKYGKVDWAKVKICVNEMPEPPAPVAPVAEDAKYHVKETKYLKGTLADLVSDPDDTTPDFTFRITDQPDEGKLYLNADTGAFVFKPKKDYDFKDEKVTFTYEVKDEQGLTDTGTVTICIDDCWGKKKYDHDDDHGKKKYFDHGGMMV